MDAIDVSRNAAEDLSEGINALVEIVVREDDSNSAAISRMRDALQLIRRGVFFPLDATAVDETLVARLDEIIATLGGVDESKLKNARAMARAYLRHLERRWLKEP